MRELDTGTLDRAAMDYAAEFLRPTVGNPHNPSFAPVGGAGWVLNSMNNFHFEDEEQYLRERMRGELGPRAYARFEEEYNKVYVPYDPDELEKNLAERLAIRPDGTVISGAKGIVKRSCRIIGWCHEAKTGLPVLVQCHAHVGESDDEAEFRKREGLARAGVVIFPLSQAPFKMALNTRISNGPAITMCDAMVDSLDLGTGAAIVRGYTGAQPTDPDTAASGTLLFTLVCSDPAFGAASDIAPGARATASAITNDSSADATGTLGYCRGWTTNDGATPLTAKIDGEAGTSGADFNFNTVSIVSGATVGITSWTVTMPES